MFEANASWNLCRMGEFFVHLPKNSPPPSLPNHIRTEPAKEAVTLFFHIGLMGFATFKEFSFLRFEEKDLGVSTLKMKN